MSIKIYYDKNGKYGKLLKISGDFSKLRCGEFVFQCDKRLINWNKDLNSLSEADYMFYECSNLISFEGDLSSLVEGRYMFCNSNLTTFSSNLASLTAANAMFSGCKLNVESVENIASSINTYNGGQITIHVDDTLSTSNKNTILSHFNTIQQKGWTVNSNLSTTAALNEDDEPIEDTSVYVKLEEANDYHCTHTDKDGNKVILHNAKYVGGPRQHEWTLFASVEGAEQFFGLTRIVDELNNNT